MMAGATRIGIAQKCRLLGGAALIATGAATPPASAQQSAPPEVTVLEPLTVGADRATTATKTDTRLTETPQAISVVPSGRFTDQGAKDLQDTLRYSAGVRAEPYGTDRGRRTFSCAASVPSNISTG